MSNLSMTCYQEISAEWEYEGRWDAGVDDAVDEEFDFKSSHLGLDVEEADSSRHGFDDSQSEELLDLSDDKDPSNDNPSRRFGPGTWQSSDGSWFLFGGQGPSSTESTEQAESSASPTSSSSDSLAKLDKKRRRSVKYLSDLWRFDDSTSSWKLIYQPDGGGNPAARSSYPENLAFPQVCGSEKFRNVAVFGGNTGGLNKGKINDEPTPAPPTSFTDDNVVWLFDMPGKSLSPSSNKEKANDSWNKDSDLWTSYICCDACLPDGNTTLEFCPRFKHEPVLWCGENALMALQISSSEDPDDHHHSSPSPPPPLPPSSPRVNPETNLKEPSSLIQESPVSLPTTSSFTTHSTRPTSPLPTTTSPRSQDKSRIIFSTHSLHSIPRSSDPLSKKRTIRRAADQDQPPSSPPRRPITKDGMMKRRIIKPGKIPSFTLWKFDLGSTEWEKMPQIKIHPGAFHHFQDEDEDVLIKSSNCRSVSDYHRLYLICRRNNSLDASILLLNPETGFLQNLGEEGASTLKLNNAFTNPKVWEQGRSNLHALYLPDNRVTIIFLAYHKLLDLWIHDHLSNRLTPVENVWKGSSLHVFQRTTTFYKITLSFPPPAFSPPAPSTAFSNQGQTNIRDSSPRNYSFFMINPRAKFYDFGSSPVNSTASSESHPRTSTSGRFHLTILPDRSVFLPARDATYLLDPESVPASSSSISSSPGHEVAPAGQTGVLPGKQIPKTRASLRSLLTTASGPAAATTSPPEHLTHPITLPVSSAHNSSLDSTSRVSFMGKVVTGEIGGVEEKIDPKLNSALDSQSYPTTSEQAPKTLDYLRNQEENSEGFNLAHPVDTVSPPLNHNTGMNGLSPQSLSLTPITSTISSQERGIEIPLTGETPPATRPPDPLLSRNSSKTHHALPEGRGTNPKRISKGILRNLNGKTLVVEEGRVGKIVNLMAVKQLSTPLPLVHPSRGSLPLTIGTTTMVQQTSVEGDSIHEEDDSSRNKVGSRISQDQQISSDPSKNTSTRVVKSWNLSKLTPLPPSPPSSKPLQRSSAPIPKESTESEREDALDRARNRVPGQRKEAGQTFSTSQLTASASSSSSARRSSSISRTPGNYSPRALRGENSEENYPEESSNDTGEEMIVQNASSADELPETSDFLQSGTSTTGAAGGLGRSRTGSVIPSSSRTHSESYGSAEIVFDSRNTIQPGGAVHDSIVPVVNESYSSMLFFSFSLSIFASIGIVIFVRRCVKCPPRRQSALIVKEPPPIRYDVIPDELSYHPHTPIY